MHDHFNLTISRHFSIAFGAYGFHGQAFGRGLHLCTEARLAGERWAWLTKEDGVVTGRLGPFTFTVAASHHHPIGPQA